MRVPVFALLGAMICAALGTAAWLGRTAAVPHPPPALRSGSCVAASVAKPLVLLALGQSNAANSGARRFSARDDRVLAWSPGRCVRASDPLPGGSGKGGSVWIPVAEELARRSGRQVVLAVYAVDGTAVRDWLAPDKFLVKGLGDTLDGLRREGLSPEHVFWLQGEADLRDATPAPAYRRGLGEILGRVHRAAPAAKIWIAQASRCRNEGSAELRAVQRELAATLDYARQGPDIDRLDARFRRDACHFNETGQRAAAAAWLASLAKEMR